MDIRPHSRVPMTSNMNDSRAQQHKLKSTRQKQLAERPRPTHPHRTQSTPRAQPTTVPGQATRAPGYQPGYHQGPCPLAYNGKKGAAKLATGRSPLGRTGCIITLITGICWPGWLGQASWVPGKCSTPTDRRPRAAYKPRLGLGHWAKPGTTGI